MRWFASLVLFIYRMLRCWPLPAQRLRAQLTCIDLAIDVYFYNRLDEHVVALMPVYTALHAAVHGATPVGDPAAALMNRLVAFGRVLIQAGHEQRGEELLARADTLFRTATPPVPTPVWAASIFNLGGAYLELARAPEALPWLEKARAIRLTLHGSDSFEAAQCHNNLGNCLTRLGRFAEAEQAIEEAIRLHTRHSGAKSSEVAGAIGNLAENRLRRGLPEEALTLIQKAIDGTLGSDAIRADLLDCLSDIYAALGRLQECRLAADRSIDIALRNGRVATAIATARKITDHLESAGRDAEAAEYRDMAEELQRRHHFHKAT